MTRFHLRQVVTDFFEQKIRHAEETDDVQVWRELPFGQLKVIRTRIDLKTSSSVMLIEVHEHADGNMQDISLEIKTGQHCYTTYFRKEHLQADPTILFTLWTVTPKSGGRQVQFPWVDMRQKILLDDPSHHIFCDLAEHVMHTLKSIM